MYSGIDRGMLFFHSKLNNDFLRGYNDSTLVMHIRSLLKCIVLFDALTPLTQRLEGKERG